MPFQFNLQLVAVAAGLLYILMALTVWAMLHKRHPRVPTRLWSLGSLSVGLGLVLVQLIDTVPHWAYYRLALWLLLWSMPLRLAALRLDLGLPSRSRLLLGLTLAGMLGFELADRVPGVSTRTVFGTLLLLVGLVALAWYSRALGLAIPSRSGLLLAWAEAAAALGMLARTAWIIRSDSFNLVSTGPGLFMAYMVLAGVAAIYSNLGYLGMAFDRRRAAQRAALAAEQAARLQADTALRVAEELRDLLAQRDRLLDERSRLLQLLAHEIRQPLHNANGALQMARQALQGELQHVGQATAPLQRAQAVLGDVHAVLDNTLAAASLLSQDRAPALQEIELSLLLALSLGDLSPEQRARVQVQPHPQLHSAELEPGLLRLALRNLLRNAFLHGGPEVQVQLRVGERIAPPALLLSVCDNGVGTPLAEPLAAQLDAMQDTDPGPSGLGLRVVRQVARLHGGRLEVSANSPQGLCFSLVLPLPGA